MHEASQCLQLMGSVLVTGNAARYRTYTKPVAWSYMILGVRKVGDSDSKASGLVDIDNQCLLAYCKLFKILWQNWSSAHQNLQHTQQGSQHESLMPARDGCLGRGLTSAVVIRDTLVAESWGLCEILTQREFFGETRATWSVSVQGLWGNLGTESTNRKSQVRNQERAIQGQGS